MVARGRAWSENESPNLVPDSPRISVIISPRDDLARDKDRAVGESAKDPANVRWMSGSRALLATSR